MPRDVPTATEWFRKAALQGHSQAQFNLAESYRTGEGVPSKDPAQMVAWYTQAAAQGMPMAQTYLGVVYAHGDGVPRDDARAADLYRKAAMQGDAMAHCNLGIQYAFGRGVPFDQVLADFNVRIAGEQRLSQAPEALKQLAAKMSRAQIDEADHLVETWQVGQPLPDKSSTGQDAAAAL